MMRAEAVSCFVDHGYEVAAHNGKCACHKEMPTEQSLCVHRIMRDSRLVIKQS